MFNPLTILQTLTPVDLDAGTVFSGSPSGKMVRGYAAATPFTPAAVPLQ
jgi:cobaltochelatase CobS